MHVVSCEEEFQQQKLDLLWRKLDAQAPLSQVSDDGAPPRPRGSLKTCQGAPLADWSKRGLTLGFRETIVLGSGQLQQVQSAGRWDLEAHPGEHWRLAELRPEGLERVALSLVVQGRRV